VLRRLGRSAPGVAILAGQGTFLARAALRGANLEVRELSNDMDAAAARAAPATAVAYLLAQMSAVDSL
jgi:uncharacterized hydantoinase/oxoprolinase family protein